MEEASFLSSYYFQLHSNYYYLQNQYLLLPWAYRYSTSICNQVTLTRTIVTFGQSCNNHLHPACANIHSSSIQNLPICSHITHSMAFQSPIPAWSSPFLSSCYLTDICLSRTTVMTARASWHNEEIPDPNSELAVKTLTHQKQPWTQESDKKELGESFGQLNWGPFSSLTMI